MSNHTTMRTVSGNHMDLLNPSVDAVSRYDIAYSLARIKRFTGHTTISVAQHSIEVMMGLYMRPDFSEVWRGTARTALLYALLHDAHEAYTGDISRPMNNAIAEFSSGVESPVNGIKRRVQRVIHEHFGLLEEPGTALRAAIGVADRKMLDIDRWLFNGVRTRSMTEDEVQWEFLRTLNKLLEPDGASFVGQYDEWPDNEIEQRCKIKDFGLYFRTPEDQRTGLSSIVNSSTAKGRHPNA